MGILMIGLGVLGVLVGASSLTQATLGVGVICGSCFLLILARIMQAHDQHKELIKRIDLLERKGSNE